MRRIQTRLFIALTVLIARPILADQPVDFNRDIRPLLSDRCFACHGPDSNHRQADLRLDIEDAAKAYAIDLEDDAGGLFVERITSVDADLVMPPPETGKPLTADEVGLLEEWVRTGAPYADHWSYVDPIDHQPPIIEDERWDKNPIDAFLYKAALSNGFSMSEIADPATLIRRLSFDLTGLPPAVEDVRAFVADPSKKQYLNMVDQYLASDRFGERLAVVWLDLVRYANTVGYHGDQDHNIAPYRDWVIDAFNANMPFDEFTRQQLAGDLIPNATVDQKIASGYNRLLQTSHEGGVQPKEYLAIYAADRVRNVSAVWMGSTLGCAQCHDHKYDPYTAKDFYAMSAFFADLDEDQHFKVGTNALPTKRPPEIDVLRPSQRLRLAEIERELAQLESKIDSQARIEALQVERDRISADTRRTMISVSKEPRTVRLLPRGNWLDDSGPLIEPAVPGFLGRELDSPARPTRLDLANWFTDVERGTGGFTARVMANRVWAILFGAGLSESLDDFGGQGQPPQHPELLDHLAIQYFENGWDLKFLVRYIVSSRAYQQSSVSSEERRQSDPTNRFFARQNRNRLSAEMIRDQALALGNLLVLSEGGSSARPYQPAGYFRHLNFPPREYASDNNTNQYRRGVYVHWQRQFLHPMLKAFDAPTREECTARRYRSNTPLAALTLMNDPTFIEAANAFANQLLLNDSLATDADRVSFAFELATSREPDESEKAVLLKSLEISRRYFDINADAVASRLDVGLYEIVDRSDQPIDRAELASWSEFSRTLLNLSETITRP